MTQGTDETPTGTPSNDESSKTEEKPSTVSEAFNRLLLHYLQEILVSSRKLGVAGAIIASLGMGTYSTFAPEKEARVAYETLRPVVQQNFQEIVVLQGRIALLEKQLAALQENLEDIADDHEELAVESGSKKSKKAVSPETSSALMELSHRLKKVTGDLAVSEPAVESVPVLPMEPWEK